MKYIKVFNSDSKEIFICVIVFFSQSALAGPESWQLKKVVSLKNAPTRNSSVRVAHINF
jgi:hypothetical protein